MDKIDKRMWQIRALGRATNRKMGLPLAGSLQLEYFALANLKASPDGRLRSQ